MLELIYKQEKKLEDLLYDTTVSLDPKYRKNKTTQELMYEKEELVVL